MNWLKKLMERIFGPRCVDPKAPWVRCRTCGVKLKTCERKVAVNHDYRCPRHMGGYEWPLGEWECGECAKWDPH